MGNKLVAKFRHRREGCCLKEPIVPDQDPLLKAGVTRRIVRAEIGRDFQLESKVLGTGYSGAVRLATNYLTGQHVAVKTFSKRHLLPHKLKLLQSEVMVYLQLDHPNICRLLHAYEGKTHVWLIMELCGCELYARLCERKVYRERDAMDVMLQMLQAVNYLHSHRIVHRDLKLENWMYKDDTGDPRLKLIDFGFSKILAPDETLDMPCGTLHYTSPEVLHRKYTSLCDMWSLGVICYMLLLGRPPFSGKDHSKIAKAILHGAFRKDGRWDALSGYAQDFLTRLLEKDVRARLDASRALRHPWIREGTSASSCEVGVDVLKNLQKFAQGSHIRRAALTVMAFSLTSRELQNLDQTFLALDKSGRGTITLDQLAEVMQRSLNVTSQEVQRIFNCMDFSNDEELRYTPFIAAMLATRVKMHEGKVRTTFEAFDRDGTGFITAQSLVDAFAGMEGTASAGCLTRGEAEQWIREVDDKGNGIVGYDDFLEAMMGKKLWSLPSLESDQDQTPVVKVFGAEAEGGRGRGMSDTIVGEDIQGKLLSSSVPSWPHQNVDSMISSGEPDEEPRYQFHAGTFSIRDNCIRELQIRSVHCGVDDNYFA